MNQRKITGSSIDWDLLKERESNNQKLDQPCGCRFSPAISAVRLTDKPWSDSGDLMSPPAMARSESCLLCHKIITIIYMRHDMWDRGNNRKPRHNRVLSALNGVLIWTQTWQTFPNYMYKTSRVKEPLDTVSQKRVKSMDVTPVLSRCAGPAPPPTDITLTSLPRVMMVITPLTPANVRCWERILALTLG